MSEIKEGNCIPPPDVRANNKFVKTISMLKYAPDQKLINEALWGHPDGFEAALKDKYKNTLADMKAFKRTDNDYGSSVRDG